MVCNISKFRKNPSSAVRHNCVAAVFVAAHPYFVAISLSRNRTIGMACMGFKKYSKLYSKIKAVKREQSSHVMMNWGKRMTYSGMN